MNTLAIFCDVDDFCQLFEPDWQQFLLSAQPKQRHRRSRLCLSEVMTIIIGYHLSGYRTFKAYYTREVLQHQRREFPGLLSYSRFIELVPQTLVPLCSYLQTRFGRCSGISFIDSTSLKVCHNRRIWSHRVFAGLAQRGKTSVDWFYGFKLHLVVNDCGELLGVKLTPGNLDDRAVVPELVQHLFGKVFGDKGYISQPLFEQLWGEGVQLITKLRKRMKSKLMPLWDKLMLRKRAIIETINDQLKNLSNIEHARHRSAYNFCVNVMAGLVAYTFREKKPSLHLRLKQLPDHI